MKKTLLTLLAIVLFTMPATTTADSKTPPQTKLHPLITVQAPTTYNSWPMIQAMEDKIICIYSKGTRHNPADGTRGTYARVSTDNGKTWSKEHFVVNTPKWGNVPIGKGLDSKGNALFWVRSWGHNPHHDLFRTKDGKKFEQIATLKLNPMPMQITDIIQVPTVGLMALWFTGHYEYKGLNAWGTLTSTDDGKTWTQHVIESKLTRDKWPTEHAPAYLGNGRILAITRTEMPHNAPGTAQFQLESNDYGKTWTRAKTNISDVAYSTPSLVYDTAKDLVTVYYYVRGTGEVKRRIAKTSQVLGHPKAWPEPELLAMSSAAMWDAGNINVTVKGNIHIAAFYAGNAKRTAVQVIMVPAP